MTCLFKNNSLESDKFLISLLIFLLLKIVLKSILQALTSFQDLAGLSGVCLIYAKLYSSKRKEAGALKHMLEGL